MTALCKLDRDLNRLEVALGRFETKYGIKSDDFYQAMMTGELEEFDALDDYRLEFIEWLAIYKTWPTLNDKYRQVVGRQPLALQIKANLEIVGA